MKRLKVLLIKPYSRADEMIPPLGLGYLATAIRANHEVAIIDGLKDNLTAEAFATLITEQQPDICCFQVFTFQIPIVKEYLAIGRHLWPQAKFILGGPHPSASPEDIFTLFPEANYAFKGEAELGLAQLLDLLAAGEPSEQNLAAVPGLIWRSYHQSPENQLLNNQSPDNQLLDNQPTIKTNIIQYTSILYDYDFKNYQVIVNRQNFHCDLDGLGLPAWDLLAPQTYPIAPHGAFFKNYPIAPIIITRGCPFSCTYCSGHLINGKTIRSRSAANAVAEIKLLYDTYGIREIHIEDDNFTFDRQLVMDFCRGLQATNLNISWTCPNGVRLDTLDEELLLTMKEAGLYSLSVGIESGSDKILRDLKKSLTTETTRAKIKLIKKCGLEVCGFFILGYPTESRQDILSTIKFACSLPLKRASFALFKPFPGTEITDKLLATGELSPKTDEDWAKYILADAVYAPPGLTTKQMKQLRRLAIIAFYSRPKIIWKFIREIKNFRHLRLIIKRAVSWLFKAK